MQKHRDGELEFEFKFEKSRREVGNSVACPSAAPNKEYFDPQLGLPALNTDETHLALGDLEPVGVGLSCVDPPLNLSRVSIPPCPVIRNRAAILLRLLPLGLELLLRTEARVSVPLRCREKVNTKG